MHDEGVVEAEPEALVCQCGVQESAFLGPNMAKFQGRHARASAADHRAPGRAGNATRICIEERA